MAIISQELRAWEQEEYGNLKDTELEGTHCWYCGESIEEGSGAEAVIDIDGIPMLVPTCDNCDPPPTPPTPIAARLSCPACSQTLAPPRRHSCGGAARVPALTTVTVIAQG